MNCLHGASSIQWHFESGLQEPNLAVRRQTPAEFAYLCELEHPVKPVIEIARRIILGASLEIRAGMNWNSSTFLASNNSNEGESAARRWD